jgi:hypothetical protein
MVVAGLGLSPAFATDIIILRDLPTHNVLEQPVPDNASGVITAPVDQRDLILQLVPNGKTLGDTEVGSILPSQPPGGGAGTTFFGPGFDDFRGSSIINDLPGQGMGSFANSSLGGIGGQIDSAVGQATQSINGAVGALNSALGQ